MEFHLFNLQTVYVVIVVFVATLVRSTLGFGEALVAVPLLALLLPLSVAAPLAVLVSCAMAAIIVMQDWHHVHIRSATGLILAALPGIPLGVLLLAKGNQHVVKLILGILIAGYAIYSFAAGTHLHMQKHHRAWLIGCGFLSGVLGGAYGMNGPPLAIYGGLRGWSPQHFRATLQGYFLLASLAGLVGYAAMGVWSAPLTHYFVLSLPVVVIATLIGRAANKRIKGRGFFRFVYAGLIAIGSILILQAILA